MIAPRRPDGFPGFVLLMSYSIPKQFFFIQIALSQHNSAKMNDVTLSKIGEHSAPTIKTKPIPDLRKPGADCFILPQTACAEITSNTERSYPKISADVLEQQRHSPSLTNKPAKLVYRNNGKKGSSPNLRD